MMLLKLKNGVAYVGKDTTDKQVEDILRGKTNIKCHTLYRVDKDEI